MKANIASTLAELKIQHRLLKQAIERLEELTGDRRPRGRPRANTHLLDAPQRPGRKRSGINAAGVFTRVSPDAAHN